MIIKEATEQTVVITVHMTIIIVMIFILQLMCSLDLDNPSIIKLICLLRSASSRKASIEEQIMSRKYGAFPERGSSFVCAAKKGYFPK